MLFLILFHKFTFFYYMKRKLQTETHDDLLYIEQLWFLLIFNILDKP